MAVALKILFVTLFAVSSAHDVILGLNTQGRKIFDEVKEASPAIWKQEEKITINTTDSEVISRIVITDLRPEKDGEINIVDGGVGQKDVTIEMKSPTVLRGYIFHVEVYSAPEDQEANIGNTFKGVNTPVLDNQYTPVHPAINADITPLIPVNFHENDEKSDVTTERSDEPQDTFSGKNDKNLDLNPYLVGPVGLQKNENKEEKRSAEDIKQDKSVPAAPADSPTLATFALPAFNNTNDENKDKTIKTPILTATQLDNGASKTDSSKEDSDESSTEKINTNEDKVHLNHETLDQTSTTEEITTEAAENKPGLVQKIKPIQDTNIHFMNKRSNEESTEKSDISKGNTEEDKHPHVLVHSPDIKITPYNTPLPGLRFGFKDNTNTTKASEESTNTSNDEVTKNEGNSTVSSFNLPNPSESTHKPVNPVIRHV